MTTFLGIVSGVMLLFLAIAQQGGMTIFFSLPAAMITFGGTIAAIFISFPFPRVLGGFRAMVHAFRSDIQQPSWVIGLMVRLSFKARKESLFSLEEDIRKVSNNYIRLGLEMIIDGNPPDIIRDVLETELDFMELRHTQGEMVFRSGAKFAPAFGMIGTLIGLVSMLRGLGSTGGMEQLGMGMAVALITTFYGAMAANLFFAPVADKLKSRTTDEVLRNRIIIEGVIMLQAGINPRMIEKKLNSFLPPHLRANHFEKLMKRMKKKQKAESYEFSD